MKEIEMCVWEAGSVKTQFHCLGTSFLYPFQFCVCPHYSQDGLSSGFVLFAGTKWSNHSH